MTTQARIRCGSVDETARVARELAALCAPGQVLLLVGELGAGKTTFVAAYARALGVEAPVTSPTFTLMHQYRCGPLAAVELLLHVDLWRLEVERELDDLALDELLDEGAAAVVEWGDRLDVARDRPHLSVAFEVVDEATRVLSVDASHAELTDAALARLGT